MVDAGSEPTYAEKMRVPPPPWDLICVCTCLIKRTLGRINPYKPPDRFISDKPREKAYIRA